MIQCGDYYLTVVIALNYCVLDCIVVLFYYYVLKNCSTYTTLLYTWFTSTLLELLPLPDWFPVIGSDCAATVRYCTLYGCLPRIVPRYIPHCARGYPLTYATHIIYARCARLYLPIPH